MRQLQPGETLVSDPTPTPHAQTLLEGEALENNMAKETEEKARRDQDPGNQAQREIDRIDNSIQKDVDKVESGL